MNVLALDQLACIVGNVWDQRIFPVGTRKNQEYSVANLNIKNLMSPTPRNCDRKALTLALKDSADAFVSLRSK